jgi:hypothetical protein
MRITLLFLCFLTTLAHAQWAKTPLKPLAHLNANLYPISAQNSVSFEKGEVTNRDALRLTTLRLSGSCPNIESDIIAEPR